MHGYAPQTVLPTIELLLHHTHPEDRARVAAGFAELTGGGIFRDRFRIIDTAERTHTVVVIGDCLSDDTGKVTKASGFYLDVTA